MPIQVRRASPSRFRPQFWALGRSTAASYDKEVYCPGAFKSHPSRHVPYISLGPCTKLCPQRTIVWLRHSYFARHADTTTALRIAFPSRQCNIFVILNTCTHLSLSLVSASMTVQSEQVLTVLQRVQNSVEVVSSHSRWCNAIYPFFFRFQLARSSRKIGKTPWIF